MNVSCPECRSVFRVDPSKVPASRRSRALLGLRRHDHGRRRRVDRRGVRRGSTRRHAGDRRAGDDVGRAGERSTLPNRDAGRRSNERTGGARIRTDRAA